MKVFPLVVFALVVPRSWSGEFPCAAKWISHPNGGGELTWHEACDFSRPVTPAPVFRRRFTLGTDVENAVLRITGLGFFEAKLDGRPLDFGLLVPAPTAYDRRWRYRRMVLPALRAGEHILSVTVGDGFYRAWKQDSWRFDCAPWTDHAKMICELSDREGRILLKSDESWKVKFSPTVRTAIRGGEAYDARLEFPETETEGDGWFPALLKPAPGGIAEEEVQPPCRAGNVYELRPLEGRPGLWAPPVGVAGMPRLTVRGERGAKVTLECGEYHRRIRGGVTNETETAFADRGGVFSYVLRGGGVETWSPRFTYHAFDRVRVKTEGRVEVVKLEGVEIHTAFERSGRLVTDDPKLKRLIEVSERSALGNFVGIPTDCPHRERVGWTSESRIMSEFMLYAWNSSAGFGAYVDDMIDAQRQSGQPCGIAPTGGWGYNWGTGPAYWAALAFIPDSIGRFTGDWEPMKRALPALVKLSDFMETITGDDGLVRFGLGDWLYPNGTRAVTPVWFVTTAFAAAIDLRTAEALDRHGGDGALCRARGERLRRGVLGAFYRGGGVFSSASTTMHALALELGIVPEADRSACAAELDRIALGNGCRIDYGTMGSWCVVKQLFENGCADTAYEYMVQPDYPGYQVLFDRWRLTTLPEMWDPDRCPAGTDSRFHGVFSTVCDTMYRYLAGFRHDADLDARSSLRVRPCFPRKLGRFGAEHRGYRVGWIRSGDGIDVTLVVPRGAVAELILPGRTPERLVGGRYSRTCRGE